MLQHSFTQQLGTLEGPLLIFGGIYSNLQALEALKATADQLQIPPSNIICTGDIVAYCAHPEACINLVREWGIHCIAGNVELQLIEEAEDCGCNFENNTNCDVFSRTWYPYAKGQISASSLEWLRTLPQFLQFQYAQKKVLVLHGSYEETAQFIFKSTPWAIKEQQFQWTGAEVILAGHCGLPFVEEQAGKLWLNAGVIGMPANDASTQVWYLTLTTSAQQLLPAFHSLEYDFETAAASLEEAKLPQAYAHTLRTGIWDNCDILPPTETQQQGQPLIFSPPSPLSKA